MPNECSCTLTVTGDEVEVARFAAEATNAEQRVIDWSVPMRRDAETGELLFTYKTVRDPLDLARLAPDSEVRLCDVPKLDDKTSPSRRLYLFVSANTPPTCTLVEIAEVWPDLRFDFDYIVPNAGSAGLWHFEQGELVSAADASLDCADDEHGLRYVIRRRDEVDPLPKTTQIVSGDEMLDLHVDDTSVFRQLHRMTCALSGRPDPITGEVLAG